MTPMGRYIAAADALERAALDACDELEQAQLTQIAAKHLSLARLAEITRENAVMAMHEYRAAREAITAAGVNDMNEGKEG